MARSWLSALGPSWNCCLHKAASGLEFILSLILIMFLTDSDNVLSSSIQNNSNHHVGRSIIPEHHRYTTKILIIHQFKPNDQSGFAPVFLFPRRVRLNTQAISPPATRQVMRLTDPVAVLLACHKTVRFAMLFRIPTITAIASLRARKRYRRQQHVR